MIVNDIRSDGANCIVWTGDIDHYIVIGHESPTNPFQDLNLTLGFNL